MSRGSFQKLVTVALAKVSESTLCVGAGESPLNESCQRNELRTANNGGDEIAFFVWVDSMKRRPQSSQVPAQRKPVRLERVPDPPLKHEKRTLVVYEIKPHLIISALAALILAVGAVVS